MISMQAMEKSSSAVKEEHPGAKFLLAEVLLQSIYHIIVFSSQYYFLSNEFANSDIHVSPNVHCHLHPSQVFSKGRN